MLRSPAGRLADHLLKAAAPSVGVGQAVSRDPSEPQFIFLLTRQSPLRPQAIESVH